MKSRRTRAVTAIAAVAAIAAAVLVVGPGYHDAQLRMRTGTVWLAAARTGQATLVDGASAEVAAAVPVAEPGTALTVTQHGGAAFVLNKKTGGVSRVDSATERVSPPVPVLPASDGLVLLPAPDLLHVVDVHSGMVASVGYATLVPTGEPERLAEKIRPGSVVVDGRGRLWAIDDTTGDLVWLSKGERGTRSAATKNGRLAITRSRPVLVDPERGTAELLHPDTGVVARSVRPELRAGDKVVVGGSADQERVHIAVGSRGELISCAFGTGSCTGPVRIGSAGAELGTPVEVGDHAVVPDYSTGQVTIVDIAGSRVVAHRLLFERPTRFELFARDGIVFFNDPNSNMAGVLDLSGEVRTITKYTEEASSGDVLPTPDHRAQPDQVAKAGQQQKPGLAIPRQPGNVSAANPVPAPAPAASILVEPGSRGEVGDEFELTLALQPPNREAHARWSFGDGTEATGATVRHRWDQPGTFTVRAVATAGQAAGRQAETTITVDPAGSPPRITQLAVQRLKPVIGEPVRFSADTNRNLDRWEWTVTRSGQPTPEVTAQTPEFDHTFFTAGTYTVALTVTKGTLTARSTQQFTVARGAIKLWGSLDTKLTVPPAAAGGVVAIDAGANHALVLKSDGSVIVWGENYHHQLDAPAEALSGVVAIAAGAFHNLVLKADGSVIAWGLEREGITDIPPAAQHDVIAIAAGISHSLVLKKDGSVISWGTFMFDKWMPAPPLTGAIAIAAGGTHSMAVKADGTVVAWGDFTDFSCDTEEPVRNARAVGAGWGSCLALLTDGSITGWGVDHDGQVSIPPAAKNDVVSMDTLLWHSLALKKDGSVVGWGNNIAGQASVPPEYSHGAMAVAAGYGFSMVLLE